MYMFRIALLLSFRIIHAPMLYDIYDVIGLCLVIYVVVSIGVDPPPPGHLQQRAGVAAGVAGGGDPPA